MKEYTLTGLLAGPIFVFCGCVLPVSAERFRGSEDLTTIERDLEDFSVLELRSGCQAGITRSDRFSVVVRINENLVDYLQLEVAGRTLSIGMKKGHSYSRIQLEAEIGMPDIERLELSGGSQANISGFDLDHRLDTDLSGGSGLTGSLDTGALSMSLSGGSSAELFGAGSDVQIEGSGGSVVEMGDFLSSDVHLKLSGGSRATVNLTGRLTGQLSGGSKAYYHGEPNVEVTRSGGSNVMRK